MTEGTAALRREVTEIAVHWRSATPEEIVKVFNTCLALFDEVERLQKLYTDLLHNG